MKGPRPASRVLTVLALMGGLLAPIGCGPHPEEGTLKLPPRKRDAEPTSDTTKAKVSTSSRKARSAIADPVEGK